MAIIVIIIFCISLFSLLVSLGKKFPSLWGRIGETKVSYLLEGLPSEKYIIINDLLLKTSHGTTQIDHVVLSEYGIFVVETKNYSGWIFGNSNSEDWVKNVYGNKYKFRNPIKQNYAHIRALMEILNDKNINDFIPVIAFSNQASLKLQSCSNVMNFYRVTSFILSYHNPIISVSVLNEYAQKLRSYTNYSRESKTQHVEKIRIKTIQKNTKIRNRICPSCGGTLVTRNGKYGSFLGCSNYPKCKFTKKI